MWWCVSKKEFHDYMQIYKEWAGDKREEMSARIEMRDKLINNLSIEVGVLKGFMKELKEERHDARVIADHEAAKAKRGHRCPKS